MTTTIFLSLLFIHLLALISPWPDFFIVSKQALQFGTRAGIYTACGIACWLVVHIAYSIFGLGYIISQSIVVFNAIKIAGGLYLLRLGYHAWHAAPQHMQRVQGVAQNNSFWQWCITNVLNPKAALYFLSVFSTLIPQGTSTQELLFLWCALVLLTVLRFSLVALGCGHARVRSVYLSSQTYINTFFGVVLCGMWMKVLLTK